MPTVSITVLNNIRAHIEGPKKVIRALDDYLAFRKSKFWWKSPSSKGGRWDGRTHMLYTPTGVFPLGLLGQVRRYLKSEHIGFTIDDPREALVVPQFDSTMLEGITLRDYQMKAIEKTLGRERGIIHAAVGSGKTELAIAVTKTLGMPSTLFFTHRKKLARQTRERFAKRLNLNVEDIGLIQGGEWIEGSSGIYIAVINTLTSHKFTKQRRKLYKTCELLFVDEAHRIGSTTWYRTLNYCKARRRYGLTGTPVGRSDSGDIYLTACTGDVIAKVRARDLIKTGVLATPTIAIMPIKKPKVHGEGSDWGKIYKQGIVNNNIRNRYVVTFSKVLSKAGKKTLVLVKEIKHGKKLQDMIEGSEFVHGSLEDSAIDETVKRFEHDGLDVLIATSIFNEGIDIPSIGAVVMATGGKSPIETIQRVGRGLRKKKDNRLFVLDFMDETNEYLQAHAERRMKTYRREGFKVKMINPVFDIEKLLA